ncbi:MAG: M14 family zinc carboxypeptidase [Candidatus Heimdallarchaeaceae archaeon]
MLKKIIYFILILIIFPSIAPIITTNASYSTTSITDNNISAVNFYFNRKVQNTFINEDDYDYKWIWEEYKNAPGPIQGEDIVFWGEDMGPYHNYNETTEKLQSLEANFPDYVDLFSIGQSTEGRELWAVKLTDESKNNAKTEFYVVGAHHAREAITVENSLYFIDKLIYDFINGNETIRELLENTEIYVIPLLNPDGHSILYWYPWQRKNMAISDDDGDGRLEDEFEIKSVWDKSKNESEVVFVDIDNDGYIGEDAPGGVDLNRNYDFQWRGSGSSPDKGDEVYRGPEPNSEPEVQAMCRFAQEHDFRIALSLHSGIQAIIYPWGYTSDVPPHYSESYAIASSLKQITGFPTWNEIGGYFVNGEWGDWMLAKRDILSFTIETYGIETYEDSIWDFFNPPANQVIDNSELIYNAALYLATNPHIQEKNQLPTLSSPMLNYEPDSTNLTLSWSSSDPDGDSLTFKLYYGRDNQWYPLTENIMETHFTVDLKTLLDGKYSFRIVAYDGIDHVVINTDEVEIDYLTEGEIDYILSEDKTHLQVNITDYDANADWYNENHLQVKIASNADEAGVTLDLTEIGQRSAIFTGGIFLAKDISSNLTHLAILKEDTITITYTDNSTTTGTKEIVLSFDVSLKKVSGFSYIYVAGILLLVTTIKIQKRRNRGGRRN